MAASRHQPLLQEPVTSHLIQSFHHSPPNAIPEREGLFGPPSGPKSLLGGTKYPHPGQGRAKPLDLSP